MDERRLIAPFFVEVDNLPVFHHTITSYFVIPFSVECRHNRASSFQPIINIGKIVATTGLILYALCSV